MKKLALFTVFLFGILFAKTFKVSLLDFNLSTQGDYSVLQLEGGIYPQGAGEPAIPVKTLFIELAADEKITGVNVSFLDIKEIILQKPLSPVPAQQILTQRSLSTSKENYPEHYPNDLTFNYGQGMLGSSHIGYVAFYAAKLERNLLTLPATVQIEVRTSAQSAIVNRIDNGFTRNYFRLLFGRDEEEIYPVNGMIITSEALSQSFAALVNYRQRTGVNYRVVTTENIAAGTQGRDLQEKIRNFILQSAMEDDLSYVLLGGDEEIIPTRKLFAFDCHYGAYETENDIPSDIYYSNLDGDFDANGNGIFGEEEDNVDYFPELAVGRISVTEASQVSNYVQRLQSYEAGVREENYKALGLSMELWAGSQSQLCQEYIYRHYFPSDFRITKLYNADNNITNCFWEISTGQNIVQHTGHANWDLMSLDNGYITNTNINGWHNSYGGLFYSIGCFANALDYQSIGEHIVTVQDKGFLAFIGNSRYGWGAPSAPGFGFSEFYQKEFFNLLNEEPKATLGFLQQAQKIPFIPYLSGTSVFKWVYYELNLDGDPALHLNFWRENPDFTYSISPVNEQQYRIETSHPFTVVSDGENHTITNADGNALFSTSLPVQEISLYKAGYPLIYCQNITKVNGNLYYRKAQGESFTITQNFSGFSSDINYHAVFDSTLMEISPFAGTLLIDIPENNTLTYTCRLKNTAETRQLRNNDKIPVTFTYASDSTIVNSTVWITIDAPELVITQSNLDFVTGETLGAALFLTMESLGATLPSETVFFPSTTDSTITVLDTEFAYTPGMENVIRFDIAEPLNTYRFFNLSLTYFYLGNPYVYTFGIAVNDSSAQPVFADDFNVAGSMQNEIWQQVVTHVEDTGYCLSPRPETSGNYSVATPFFNYRPHLKIEFDYTYKMPMYGEDGLFVILNHGAQADTLLFVGAGGALGRSEYIESNWAHFSLPVDEIISHDINDNIPISISFMFKKGEATLLNNYLDNPEIGVFIDNLAISSDNITEAEDASYAASSFALRNYPNPFNPTTNIVLNLPKSGKLEISIYNVRGRLVKTVAKGEYAQGKHVFIFNAQDTASGVYFVKAAFNGKSRVHKILMLK